MKFKWPLIAKITVPVCLCSFALTWQIGRAQHANAETLQFNWQQAQDQLCALRLIEQSLRDTSTASAARGDEFAGLSLDKTLAATLHRTMSDRAKHVLTIDQLTVGEGVSGNSEISIRELGKTLPNAAGALRTVKIVVKGSYANYQQFRAFLDGYAALPAAITMLNLNQRSFEFALEVLGV